MSFEKVKEVIMDTINCDEDQITLEASLKEDLGIDSLDAMELVMALEEEYGFTISEDAYPTFKTVKNIVDHVDSLLQ